METNKLQKVLEEWVVNLGFSLPDESRFPPNYFATLTATPHRRQLWEVLVESVKDKKYIQYIRKQLLAFSLKKQSRNIHSKISDKLDLWTEQNNLREKVCEERKINEELEKKILLKASDLIFDLCKLAELIKQCDENKEKTLVLKLLNSRESKQVKELEKLLSSLKRTSNNREFVENYKETCKKKTSTIECLENNYSKCSLNEPCTFNNCQILETIENCSNTEQARKHLWKEIINRKSNQLNDLSKYLEELETTDNNIMSEKRANIENTLKLSVKKLKQLILEKSLQALNNEAEGQLLNLKIKQLIEEVEMFSFNSSSNSSLNDHGSFIAEKQISNSFHRNEVASQIRNQIDLVGQKNYQEFLESQIFCLQNDDLNIMKKNNGEESFKKDEIAILYNEISLLDTEQKKQMIQIIQIKNNIKELLKEIEDKIENKDFTTKIDETTKSLDMNCKKQIDLFLEIPLSAFSFKKNLGSADSSTLDTVSLLYQKELNQFFRTMLIHPYQTLESVFNEIKKRSQMVNKIKHFTAVREKLSKCQEDLFFKVSSLKWDFQTYEKVYKDSEDILTNILSKENKLYSDIEFLEKILRNWIEQPYKSMIKSSEMVDGLTYKEYEELYKKNINKTS